MTMVMCAGRAIHWFILQWYSMNYFNTVVTACVCHFKRLHCWRTILTRSLLVTLIPQTGTQSKRNIYIPFYPPLLLLLIVYCSMVRGCYCHRSFTVDNQYYGDYTPAGMVDYQRDQYAYNRTKFYRSVRTIMRYLYCCDICMHNNKGDHMLTRQQTGLALIAVAQLVRLDWIRRHTVVNLVCIECVSLWHGAISWTY